MAEIDISVNLPPGTPTNYRIGTTTASGKQDYISAFLPGNTIGVRSATQAWRLAESYLDEAPTVLVDKSGINPALEAANALIAAAISIEGKERNRR